VLSSGLQENDKINKTYVNVLLIYMICCQIDHGVTLFSIIYLIKMVTYLTFEASMELATVTKELKLSNYFWLQDLVMWCLEHRWAALDKLASGNCWSYLMPVVQAQEEGEDRQLGIETLGKENSLSLYTCMYITAALIIFTIT
ncbi:hypothetical protein ACJX0J_039851, partial [Zea mays]